MIPVLLIYFADSIATTTQVHKLCVKLQGFGVPLVAPYESLFYACILAYVPFGVALLMKLAQDQSNTAPRASAAKLSEKSPMYARLMGAHNNMLEGYAFFAASVLACMQVGVDAAVVSEYVTIYLASRVLFTIFYAFGFNEAIATLRTASFAGVLCTQGALFMLAAAAASKK